MNRLPPISHHLFAAAVAAEALTPRPPARPESRPPTAQGIAAAIPLELLTAAEDAPPRAARPLRTVVVAGT